MLVPGRVGAKVVSKQRNRSVQRIDRRNKSKQIRAKKREEVGFGMEIEIMSLRLLKV